MPIDIQLKDPEILVIVCPAHNGKMALPENEFFEAAGLENASRMILYDETRLKMFAGMPPELKTFQCVLDYLKNFIQEHQFKKVIITGASAGAHTAMVLGHLLKVDHVVAFSAYPYNSEKMMAEMQDPSWKTWRRTLQPLNDLEDDVRCYLDVADLIKDWNGKTEYEAHVSRHHIWDYRRAQYLEGLPHVRVITHAYDRHALSGMLKRRGELANCFRFPFKRSHPVKELFFRVVYHFKSDRDNFKKIPDSKASNHKA